MNRTAARADRFEALVAEIFVPLQKYLLRRVPNHEVDDLLSETLLVVWRRLDDIPGKSHLPWAYGVARKVLANHRRPLVRQRSLRDRLILQPTPDQAGPDARFDGDPDLEDALVGLSAEEMELVSLWAWEGLEPREIARVLETSPNAVSLRLTRLKKKIRHDLDRQSNPSSGQIQGEQAQEM